MLKLLLVIMLLFFAFVWLLLIILYWIFKYIWFFAGEFRWWLYFKIRFGWMNYKIYRDTKRINKAKAKKRNYNAI